MGFGIPKGSALELLDGTLKLRHCTDLFTMRFPPWSLPRVGNGGGKKQLVTPGHQPDARSTMGKRVRLTRKTRPGVISYHIPDPGHLDCAPFPSLEWGGEAGVPRNLFPRLGLGEFCTRRRVEPAAWGVPAGQSSRRDQCTGTGPFSTSCTQPAHTNRHTC